MALKNTSIFRRINCSAILYVYTERDSPPLGLALVTKSSVMSWTITIGARNPIVDLRRQLGFTCVGEAVACAVCVNSVHIAPYTSVTLTEHLMVNYKLGRVSNITRQRCRVTNNTWQCCWVTNTSWQCCRVTNSTWQRCLVTNTTWQPSLVTNTTWQHSLVTNTT